MNQNRSEKLNNQMRAYSEQINTLEAQVSAQTRTLDQYRTAGDEAQKAVDQAKATSDSYEKLLQVSSQSRSGEYSYTDMADALLEITRDSLGDSGKEMYDTLSDSIFPTACKRRYAAGVDSLESEDYDQAIEYLTKVVKMDESYNDGQAIYRLAQAYQGKGDTENAKTWYQKMVDTYNNSRYIEDAKKQLAILRRKLRMRLNSDTQPKHGIGLRNVQDRIHIQFGTEYGLSVYTKEHCYTKVSIHLPITRGKYSLMDQEGDEKEEEKENEYTAGCRR